MTTNKHDITGKLIKVGDKVKRLYTYEIRLKNDMPYAHILDGTKFHLQMKDIGRDFTIV